MERKRRKINIKWRIPAKWMIFGLTMGVVLATVGSIGAMNGWFGGGSSMPEDTMTKGLVGYWGFEEGSGVTVYDASSYANNGIANGGPQWSRGKFGGALTFDGSNDYVDCGNNASVLPDAWTVEGWVRVASNSQQTFMSFGGYIPGIHLEWAGTGAPLVYMGASNYRYFAAAAWNKIKDGNWHHVLFTMPGAGQSDIDNAEMYLDGVAVAKSSLSDSGAQSAKSNCYLGAEDNSPNYPLNGTMDEVRIYNRVLSASEIRYHYNRGGPVGQWKMDEGSGTTAYDSTDNNNDGMLKYMSTSTSGGWTMGKYGTALSFDGVDDYIQVANSASLQAVGDLTIGVWLYPKDMAASGYQTIIYKDYNKEYEILITPSGGVEFYHGDGSWEYIFSGIYVVENQWNHLVVIRNMSEKKVYFYLNGSLRNSVAFTKTPVAGSNDVIIGNRGGSDRYFNGLIDDVRIYNYARTSSQVRQDYNAGFAALFGPQTGCDQDPSSCVTNGLVGSWGFEEGSGNKSYDSSNNGNTGTLIYMVTPTNSWTKGKVGGALQFDGADDYVVTGAMPAETGDHTVAFWVKYSSTQGMTYPTFYNRNGQSGSAGFWWVYTGGLSRTVNWQYANGSTYRAVGWGNAIDYDTFTHLVFTYNDANKQITLYKNGVSLGTQSTPSALLLNATALYVGNYQGAGGYTINGIIDEFRVYNRILSASEIRYQYNRGGPVGQWKFDEGEGRIAYDSSGNGNNGTLVLGGSATSSAWVAGKDGTALSFDGVDDYVDGGTTVPHFTSENFTISFWTKRIYVYNHLPISYGVQNSNGWYINQLTANGFDLATCQSGVCQYTYSNTNVLADNVWGFVTVVRNGPSASIYVNGVDVTRTHATHINPVLTPSQKLYIGSYQTNLNFNGSLDDVRIYNYARSPDEIKLDYNGGYAAHFGPKTTCNEDPGSCMTQGLVGYWGFEEGNGITAYDSSNYANDGILTNGPAWTRGKVGGALSFDGSDYVDAGTGSSFDIANDITLEVWINFSSLGNNLHTIIGKGSETANKLYWLAYDHRGSSANWWIELGNGSTVNRISTAWTPAINTWYHIVFTFSGGIGSLYINGVNYASKSYGFSTINPYVGQPVTIGKGPYSSSYYFYGLIDEIRIYNRALSAEEIRYHYNKGAPVGWWKFDEGDGRTVYDSGGNGNNGTLVLAGSATSSAWVAGKYGGALSFDGVDDYVSLGSGASLMPTTAITYEAWVNLQQKDSQQKDVIASADPYFLYFPSSATDVIQRNPRAQITGLSDINLSANSSVAYGQWTHLAVTYDSNGGSGNYRIYINGVLDSSKTVTGTITGTSGETRIGSHFSSVSNLFNGLIDDVRVYNYARTPSQIQQDYNAGTGTHFK